MTKLVISYAKLCHFPGLFGKWLLILNHLEFGSRLALVIGMTTVQQPIRFYVTPKPARVGWYVKRIVVVNNEEMDARTFDYFRTKKEAQAFAEQKNQELKEAGLYVGIRSFESHA